jgi:imidazoleglycerol-phosphate dehydratase
MRSGVVERRTKESDVRAELLLDASNPPQIETGVRMFDHLLEQLAFHSRCTLQLRAASLDGLQHHVVEDAAIVLGRALDAALGDRFGIERYGEATIPLDEALVRAVVDLGGRAYARITLALDCERIEDLAAPMIPHVLSSFAQNARMALHVDVLAGSDPHHVAEAAFKALARALARAWSRDRAPAAVPSTKGAIG